MLSELPAVAVVQPGVIRRHCDLISEGEDASWDLNVSFFSQEQNTGLFVK